MELSTGAALRMLRQRMLLDSTTCISSVGSQAGPSPCEMPDGPTADQSGPVPVPVNHSPQRASKKAPKTKGISGQKCSDLSNSAVPEQSSESKSAVQRLSEKLTEKMAAILQSRPFGSMEYALTWKEHRTPARRLIYRLRASNPRKSAKGCGGWPSPAAQNADGGVNPDGNTGNHFTLQTAAGLAGWPAPDSSHHGSTEPELALKRVTSHLNGGPKFSANLDDIAALTGWPTPQVHQGPNNGENRGKNHGGKRARLTPQNIEDLAGWPTPTSMSFADSHQPGNNRSMNQTLALVDAAEMAGWSTPSTRDHKDSAGMSETGLNPDGSLRSRLDQLPRQVHGLISESSHVETTSSAGSVLNAAMSRWLMGFPPAWDQSSPNFSEWDSVQKMLRDSSGPQASFWQKLAETVSSDSRGTATQLLM